MPRPITKDSLIQEIKKERGALEKFLSSLTPEQMTTPGALGEWSVKDVLAHLAEWEQMFLGWYNTGLEGERPHMPAPGYTWAQTPALNQKIYEKHRDRPLEDVLAWFAESHRQIYALIEQLSNDDLTIPGRFPWTKQNTLITYLVSATSSHYHWAHTEMRKRLKKMALPA